MAIGKHAEESMEEQEIDLTPLIDCFLMLIIFFSCLEFKSLEAKLPAYLPTVSSRLKDSESVEYDGGTRIL